MKQLEVKKVTRETWLEQATQLLNDDVFAGAGLNVPNDVRVSCGFPLGVRAGSKHMAIGVCHPRSHSTGGVNEIFINPNQDDSLRVLDVLAHELIHAIDDCADGHGAKFRSMALGIGLTGKMTATVATPELEEKLKAIQVKLGEYPHSEVMMHKKKQSARMLKHVCELDCGASCYQSAKQSSENPMLCSSCSGMQEDEMGYEEYVEVYMVQA